MNVPIKRGTARRLSIVQPLPPGVYWAPLPGPRGVAVMTALVARGTARRLGLRPWWPHFLPADRVKLSEEDLADFARRFAEILKRPGTSWSFRTTTFGQDVVEP